MSAVINIWGLVGGHSIYSNLLSFNWDVSDSVFGRYNALRRLKEFEVTRKPDKYSNLLFQLSANGGSIDLIKVTMTYTDEDGYPAKGSSIFSDSVVSMMKLSGKGNVVESITFNYSSVQFER
jgi:type VI protein secretion system component Hcp